MHLTGSSPVIPLPGVLCPCPMFDAQDVSPSLESRHGCSRMDRTYGTAIHGGEGLDWDALSGPATAACESSTAMGIVRVRDSPSRTHVSEASVADLESSELR